VLRKDSRMILLLLLSLLAQGDGSRVKERYVYDNQIMFRESGIVINKAVFIHVKFQVDMRPTLDAIAEIGKKLKDVNKAEIDNSKLNILPYLMGSESNNSIWRKDEAATLWRKRSMDGVAITGMLHTMFNRSVHSLDQALKVLPYRYEINRGHRFHERQKRFIGLFLGGYNMYKIDRLEKNFKNLTSKYNILIDYVQELSGKHIQLAVDTALLKDLVIFLSNKNYHKIITLVMTLQDQLKDTISDVRAIAREGNRGRMAPEMLGGEELIEFFEMMRQKAEERKCRMVMETPNDVYDLDATYGFDQVNKTFIVYLHVPMYEIGEELKLWEYVPFPILQSLVLNATITPQTGKENFIALMPDDTIRKSDGNEAPHRYRIMNEYDLNMCRRIRNTYLCGGRNTLRTDIHKSCIGNLYQRSHEGIARTCDLEIGRLEEYVAKIGVNRWIIFSPTPFMENAICGQERESLKFEIQTILELPEDCRVNLRSTQLSTDININIEYEIKRFDWKYDGNIFSELEIDDKDLAVLMQEMISTKSKFGLKDLNHLKHYFEYTENGLTKMFDYISDMFNFLFMLDDILIVVIVVVIAIGLFILFTRMGFTCNILRCLKGGNTVANMAPIGAQLLEVVTERRNSLGNLNQIIPRIDPPPYVEATAPIIPPLESGGVIRRTDSTLSIDSRYEPSQLREERRTVAPRGCNPGPIVERGLRRDSFVCTQHPVDGRPNLCAGYYSRERERPRSVRFGDEDEII